MELLKIGDKVYNANHSSFSRNVNYKFATVERLTKTQAILSNGTKLINEPIKGYYERDYGFCVYGDKYTKWYLATDEILLKAEKEKERQLIKSWFNNKIKTFTDEEKKIIYLHFKELNLHQ